MEPVQHGGHRERALRRHRHHRCLYHRDKTGEGQAVSTSIVNAGLLHTSYAWIHADGSTGETGTMSMVTSTGCRPSTGCTSAADGAWVFLAAVSAEERARLGKAGGRSRCCHRGHRASRGAPHRAWPADGGGVLRPARRRRCAGRDHRRDILSLDLRRPGGQGIATGDRNLVGQRGSVRGSGPARQPVAGGVRDSTRPVDVRRTLPGDPPRTRILRRPRSTTWPPNGHSRSDGDGRAMSEPGGRGRPAPILTEDNHCLLGGGSGGQAGRPTM